MKITRLLLPFFILPCTPSALAEPVTFHQADNRVEVRVGDTPFTTLWTEGYKTPILWPVTGPKGVRMTRDYPIKKDTRGESPDHPHHKGIFLGHQGTNGSDFWHDQNEESGSIKALGVDASSPERLSAMLQWEIHDGTAIARELRTWRFGATDTTRFIDVTLAITPVGGPLTFEAWKDGFAAIRTHPHLRLKPDPKKGVEAFGQAINSAGVTGKAIWAKRANWVHYYGPVEGQDAGIVFMSHPDNVRHGEGGAWWHARDYGLISCNPFAPEKIGGDGALTVPKGETLTLRYRWVFHALPGAEADPDRWFKAWVGE